MLLSFMELLEAKKTAQPQEKDPKDDLLDHWRTQAATIEPKPHPRRRWLWLNDESYQGRIVGKIGISPHKHTSNARGLSVISYPLSGRRSRGDGSGENARRFSYQLTVI